MSRTAPAAAALALALAGGGCAATFERASGADHAEARRSLDTPGRTEAPAAELDGSLESYLAAAARRSPSLRASFERWRAALERIPQARRLPEPMLSYELFLVGGAVGGHRLGLSQAFPWPTKLTAGAEAAAAAARAEQRRFEALGLSLEREVVEAWLEAWRAERLHAIASDQVIVLESLSAMMAGRVAAAGAPLAALQQVDLAAARERDRVAALEEEARAARARLARLVGLGAAGARAPIAGEPPAPGLPADELARLVEDATRHPRIRALELTGRSSEERARAAAADRLPGFSLGVEVEIGRAMDGQGPEGETAYPVMLMVGLGLPLWQRAYGAAVAEARAEARAAGAEADDQRLAAEAAVEVSLASLRDAARRIELYERTLVPQAEAAYASVVGAYQVGGSVVSDALRGQQDLLELQLGLVEARAEHAAAWARLEEAVGRRLERAASGEAP